jgi:hypothetical protein
MELTLSRMFSALADRMQSSLPLQEPLISSGSLSATASYPEKFTGF